MKIRPIICLALCLVGFAIGSQADLQVAAAQNFYRDYARPADYQPDDPWVKGRVFQAQTGHAGWFYNCDRQEDKRFSPYIHWGHQPTFCTPREFGWWNICKQIHEVKRRIVQKRGQEPNWQFR